MLLGFKSRSTTTAFLAGIAVVVVALGGWAYQFGFGRLSMLVALGQFTDTEIASVLFAYRGSIMLFLIAVVLLLLAVLGTAISAERARRRGIKELIHWMRHRGCPIDEDHALKSTDEGMEELMKMVEALFPREPRGSEAAMTRKEELEAFKSRFLELITHQLQTPLTSIRWNLDALLSEELGPLNRRQKDVLAVTDRNYEGLLTMIGDWIEALDVERGFLRMNFEALELEKYIDLVLRDYQHQTVTKDITVRKKLSKSLPPVRADKAKLLFVLKKLFHNAVSYTKEGGTVEVRARKTGDYVRVEIQDSGVGIPYDEQKWIFKKFFRASNATLIEPNASGVGLFVAKTLIEAMGGQIAFNSEEDVGTTFIFTTPIAGPSEGVSKHGALLSQKSVKMKVGKRGTKKRSVSSRKGTLAKRAATKAGARKARPKKVSAKKGRSGKNVSKTPGKKSRTGKTSL